MELKGLADQLNSACEAHFGVSQFSGIPLRDELHQANSLEPDFESIGCQGGKFLKATFLDLADLNRRIQNRENLIKATLKKVFKDETTYALKECGTGIRPRWSDLGFQDPAYFSEEPEKVGTSIQTLYFFEEPYFQGGRRIWKILFCNCGKDVESQPCPKYRRGFGNKQCLSLEISLEQNLQEIDREIKIEDCEELLELWRAFELAPAISNNFAAWLEFDGTQKDEAMIEYYNDTFKEQILDPLNTRTAEGSSSCVETSSPSLKEVSRCEKFSLPAPVRRP
eukprot:GHVP01020644.1.p1 GENE.GHVP01020644.1~~GHVP01020644.1.p1  ORF type:complete len:281 (+),score=52.76 GHVP01020644.1:22-864(+)